MHIPPFCPNSSCSEHYRKSSDAPARWWIHHGFYHSTRAGTVRRYQCKVCAHHFSEATFSLHYCTKKRINLFRVKSLISNGSSIRATARQMRVSPTTITHRIMLLSRQSVAAHGFLTENQSPPEDLVADGFQSFWVSQYHPNNFNLLAGADSQYLYGMTTVTLRRSGKMTVRQLRRREEIESRFPPEPGALERSFDELIVIASRLWHDTPRTNRVLRTDEHQTYARSIQRWKDVGITHLTVSSREPRTAGNPLFAVNYLDREIRKDLAEHHRETVCFARNAAVSTARIWLYMVSHNLDKSFRICPRQKISHAEVAGIDPAEVLRVRRWMMTERAFFNRSRLDHMLRIVWSAMTATPEGKNLVNRRLTPGYVMA